MADPHGEGSADWTIGRVLQWAGEDFRSRGLDSPRLDAELLLAEVLGTDRLHLILERDRPLVSAELARYRELLTRRRSGEPVAYILGRREFYGLTFCVDRRVLVPRPDTEMLVGVALERTRTRDLFGHAVDLCTGSGCVAIAFARERPTWQVTGIDIDPAAIAVARHNALRLGATPTTRFMTADLWGPLTDGDPVDLVMVNPPYIPTAEYERLDRGILDYEPRLALDGGADGLDVVRRIVQATPRRLAAGGVLAVEVHCDQGDEVAELFARAGLQQVQRERDFAGHERVMSARKP
jgi:release factor glutamine methyltransferase